ncbi:SH3 domain-containing protein 19 [Adelges cooleyi]|uniref:SH3 domain-containing protein 19 n=1 Tax=Adelges cooleyi TaxID=133065 RepID=UPI00217F24E1|nr:SH3 domain-containing protein 19 [Adelges cooleyi]
MAHWTASTTENSPKIPNRPAPPPPKINKSLSQTRLAKVLSLKQSKLLNGFQQPVKKKPPPRPPPPKCIQPLKNQSKSGLTSLIGFKTKHNVPTPPWVGKQNEIATSSSVSQVGCLIDLSSPPTSPTLTHKSSSDGNSVDSFSSDFGPWKESQAESSGFEDDFDLLSTNGDMDYFKKPFLFSQSTELSPPPPSLPPPMLPPDALNVLLNGPKLPPRPIKYSNLSSESQSKCVAQFDYVSNHTDDLAFKQGDEILLTRKINDDWLEGELDGRSGMFPSSYVKITKALLEENGINKKCYKVVAVFTFKPECWEDLSIQEGDEIQVLKRINNDWLYGECNGLKGQFPSNFVTELPDDL